MASVYRFKTNDEKGWWKSWKALCILRDGLCTFVEDTIKSTHTLAINSLPAISKCAIRGTVQNHSCDNHFISAIEKLRSAHYKPFGNKMLKNSDRTKLCSSEWEFAKCFIHADGYRNKTSIQETDLNGIISIVKNCSTFQNYFTFSLTDPNKPLEKVGF